MKNHFMNVFNPKPFTECSQFKKAHLTSSFTLQLATEMN